MLWITYSEERRKITAKSFGDKYPSYINLTQYIGFFSSRKSEDTILLYGFVKNLDKKLGRIAFN